MNPGYFANYVEYSSGKTDNKSLYSGHAYSVLAFDKTADKVTYINPWNSALTYDMQLKDLASHINGVCLSRYK